MNGKRFQQMLVLALGIMLALLTRPGAAQCSIPAGWQPYTVVSGDNLYRLGLRFNSSVSALRAGNCLSGTRIFTGQTLYVPGGDVPSVPNTGSGEQRISTPATFQRFEAGFMIWRADTGDIWVYEQIRTAVKSRNRLTIHPVSQYGGLATPTISAPGQLITPVMGFGKVWSNLSTYRDTIGWATQPETAYRLLLRGTGSNLMEFTLPDGTTITRYGDGFWSDIPDNPVVIPTGIPTPIIASGPSAHISSPANGTPFTSGTSISVFGDATGIFEASFVLELRAVPGGNLLASQVVTYLAADVAQTANWSALLTPSAYLGAAEIRVVYIQPRDGAQTMLAVVPVMLR